MRTIATAAVAFATIATFAGASPAAACLAYSDPIDTADFDGPPDLVLFATAARGGPPSEDDFTFSNMVAVRGPQPRHLTLGPSDDWECHGPRFRRGDRVLILAWGRLDNVGLPLIWRVGSDGQVLPGVGFTPRVDGETPTRLDEILNPYGIDVPDSAMFPPSRAWAPAIGCLLIALSAVLLLNRRTAKP
jgi:hypothetical protein